MHVDETSPLPGRWWSDASPRVKPVMEDLAHNSVRDIAVQCAAQSAKPQTVMNCACWAIAEDPGAAIWVTATKDERRDFLRDRMAPAAAVRCGFNSGQKQHRDGTSGVEILAPAPWINALGPHIPCAGAKALGRRLGPVLDYVYHNERAERLHFFRLGDAYRVAEAAKRGR